MKLDKLSRNDMQVAVSAIVLVLSLLLFPWFSISLGPLTADLTGTGAPDGGLGVLAFIFALLVLADLLVERYSPQTDVPPLGGSREMTRFTLAVVAAVLLALKFIFHVHFNYFGWGFYVDVVATVVLVYSTLEARRGPLT